MSQTVEDAQGGPLQAIATQPLLPAAHTHGPGMEKVLTYAMLATSIAAAAIVAAPLGLPLIGIGEEEEAKLIADCCKTIPPESGLTHAASNFLKDIPVVGTHLNTVNGQNLLAPAAIMLGGQAVGSLVSDIEHKKGRDGSIGASIRVSSLGLGSILALPAMMPGIAHGMAFLDRVAGLDDALLPLARDLGTDACAVSGDGSIQTKNAFAAVAGTRAGASLLAGHTMCLAPALITAMSAGLPATKRFTDKETARRDTQPTQQAIS